MRITIRTGNAAFRSECGDRPELETARILRTLAARLEAYGMPDPGDPIILMDYNGNRVGKAEGR